MGKTKRNRKVLFVFFLEFRVIFNSKNSHRNLKGKIFSLEKLSVLKIKTVVLSRYIIARFFNIPVCGQGCHNRNIFLIVFVPILNYIYINM